MFCALVVVDVDVHTKQFRLSSRACSLLIFVILDLQTFAFQQNYFRKKLSDLKNLKFNVLTKHLSLRKRMKKNTLIILKPCIHFYQNEKNDVFGI